MSAPEFEKEARELCETITQTHYEILGTKDQIHHGVNCEICDTLRTLVKAAAKQERERIADYLNTLGPVRGEHPLAARIRKGEV